MYVHKVHDHCFDPFFLSFVRKKKKGETNTLYDIVYQPLDHAQSTVIMKCNTFNMGNL